MSTAQVVQARVPYTSDILVPPNGCVKLKHKKIPVGDQIADKKLDPEAEPFVFTRGKVDVSRFQALLRSRGHAIWSDEEHKRSNVKLTRPAHDRWGIRKVVFVYSDDFMKQVYRFPWYRDAEWREALQPVFDVLGVTEDKVLRCLMASMPAGCVIPVHHDTGHWVQHTHRIHLAIRTNVDQVDFLVGPAPDRMRKVSFEEGRVVELNNQAKHAVTNGWEHDRVHLILDYVEDYPLSIVDLAPGAKLAQTRRSIDVVGRAEREMCIPAFVVIGGQKCGTTLLYECLNQHPLVAKGKRRETHCFDWRWKPELATVKQQRDYYMSFFREKELRLHKSIVTGESTPSYLLRGDVVIPRLKAVAGSTRILVMLRDPVKRAHSQYQMAVDPVGTPEQLKSRGGAGWRRMSFEEVVAEAKAELSKAGVGPETTPAEFARDYLSTRPNGFGAHSLLGRGLYALQLRPWLEAFGEGQVKVIFLEEMVESKEAFEATMEGVFSHVGLPPSPVQDLEPKNSRDYKPMTDDMKDHLRRFYEPYDEALRVLLGRETLPWGSGRT